MIDSLRIGCRTIAVEWPGNCTLEDDEKWADYDSRRGIIRVATFQRPPDAITEKLVHEIIHALLDDSGGEWTPKQEEAFVRLLSPRLSAFMRDNADAVREILNMLSR